jgi:hypothetical protein
MQGKLCAAVTAFSFKIKTLFVLLKSFSRPVMASRDGRTKQDATKLVLYECKYEIGYIVGVVL